LIQQTDLITSGEIDILNTEVGPWAATYPSNTIANLFVNWVGTWSTSYPSNTITQIANLHGTEIATNTATLAQLGNTWIGDSASPVTANTWGSGTYDVFGLSGNVYIISRYVGTTNASTYVTPPTILANTNYFIINVKGVYNISLTKWYISVVASGQLSIYLNGTNLIANATPQTFYQSLSLSVSIPLSVNDQIYASFNIGSGGGNTYTGTPRFAITYIGPG